MSDNKAESDLSPNDKTNIPEDDPNKNFVDPVSVAVIGSVGWFTIKAAFQGIVGWVAVKLFAPIWDKCKQLKSK